MTFEEEKFFEMHLTSDHRGIVIIFTIRNTSIFDIQSKYNNIRFVEIKSSSKRINHSTDPSAIIERRTAKGLKSVSGNFPSYPRHTNNLNRWPNNSSVQFELGTEKLKTDHESS